MKVVVNEARKKRRVAIDAVLLFIVVLLITQMWLLTATLESYLAGHTDVARPGVIASGVLFLGSLGLYRLVVQLDQSPDVEEEPHGLGPWDIR